MSALPGQTEMERARPGRDASYDGAFFVAVRSTGIFCRPSCPARRAQAKNVAYYGSVREALFAGFRPCRRCRPMAAAGPEAPWVERLLARVEEDPSRRLKEADVRALGVDPAKARRHFQKAYGITFHAYVRARRLSGTLTEIRRGGRRPALALASALPQPEGIVAAWIETPIGPLVAGASKDGVCLLEFTERRMLETQFDTLRRRLRLPITPGSNPHLVELESQLSEYFAGRRFRFDLPLVNPGTDFEKSVWDALVKIPYGGTATYRDLARQLGKPGAARAVGHANGCNRIAIVVPCHRVVGAGGTLGGYGGGIWRKRRLLELESSHVEAPAAIG